MLGKIWRLQGKYANGMPTTQRHLNPLNKKRFFASRPISSFDVTERIRLMKRIHETFDTFHEVVMRFTERTLGVIGATSPDIAVLVHLPPA
jgi:hypothetical protein